MQSDPIHVVLLSGGSGTRLWPLSNAARSKQFLKVLRDEEGNPESMVQRTVRLVGEQCPDARVTVATSAAQIDALEYQLGSSYAVSLEPERRDTAPAIMLAAAHVAWKQGASRDATVVVMPIDTYADPAYYQSVAKLDAAVQADVADLVLLGVEPSRLSSKFGYIVPAADVRAAKDSSCAPLAVARFVEKPSHELAAELIEQGALWNCGVFAFRLGYLLDIVAAYSSATSYEDLRERYAELPRNSFDYEVVEKARSVAAIPYAGAWKDLGTWGTLCEELSQKTTGNVWLDDATVSDVHVLNETDLPLVVAGLERAVVVATSDGILVAGKDFDVRVRDLVSQAALPDPMYERRQWGTYRVLAPHVRELTIDAGRELECVMSEGQVATYSVTFGHGEFAEEDCGAQAWRDLCPGDSVQVRPESLCVIRATEKMLVIEVLCDQNAGGAE